ncbi:putative filament-forming protein [Aspergillus steynii IBT 23096]|uniref:Putative filament-forming protein n=1 Tax=Aspergillus steynii IBT 23096 TaxID=1392250 RepID=A0A2I2GB88_9EURO|nr:putative filament-forming protein [Aspergillus steynii IBT 23096]PLB50146.1 putative filament-forming protein [Aspergillus steynii IBT 23096]
MAAATIELPYLASHYSIAESALNTLTQAPTVELVNQLLEAITKKARDHDELKSDKLRLEVELENAVRSSDSKIKVLKNSVEKGHAEVEETRKKLHEAENTCSNLESEIASLKSSSTSNESEVSSLKSRISSLEASNRDTLSLLESKSAAYDKLAEDLSTQHKKAIELRRELSTAEQNLQAANSASASARFREQSLEQDLDLTKKNNEWFETELKTKSAEYLKFRKEKSARISELQRENEEAISTIDSLRRSENALKSRLDEVEQRYEESLSTIHQLREDAIQAAESFRIELDSANRLAELQGNAAETAKQRVQECQLALEKAQDDAAEEISRLRVEVETEHSDKEAAERRVAELELSVSQLESEGAGSRNAMSPGLNGGPSTPMRASTPIGAFSPRTSRGKGSLTLTQMYTEYDKMRTLLAAEQKTGQELRTTVDEMMQDLEACKPEIDELRAENTRLQDAVVEMSNILESSGKERDDATKEARKWQGQVEGLSREGDILRQQLRDLSAQIKVLVLEVAIMKEGEGSYDREELEKVARKEIDDSAAELTPTGRFISHNLMTFKDLHELQEQNVTLRRMLRELGDKMEGVEAREKDAVRQQEQEELKELRIRVQTYRDEISNLVAQTKSYVKERDTFRSMLTRRRQTVGDSSVFSQSLPLGAAPPTEEQAKDTTDYADLLRKVQAHFDSFREESATDHSALKQQVHDLSRKNSELMSEISRSSSQLGAASQRAELLQSNFTMLKNENSELQKRYATLLENANRQDLKTQQAAEDLVETKGLVESLQRESANLKAEKSLWKNIEKRLIEDNETLRNERGRLDSLNANLQTILNEREHNESERTRRLEHNVESLESELQSTKRKLNDEVEESRKASLRREYEHEQSQKRIDDLVTSLGSVREELVATKTTRDHLQTRVDELTVELRSAEERIQVVQSKPSAPAPAAEQPEATEENGQSSDLTREQELGIQVAELKRDLDLAKGELEHAKEQVEDYKAISQATEERLQSVTDTNEQYREDTDRLVEEKDKKIQDLEKRIEEISSELSTTNTELSKIRDEQGEAARRLEEQKTALETEITRLKDENERQVTSSQFHQDDIKAQAEIAQHAQQNYEAELVKHADAAKNLQLVRSEANQLRLELVEVRTKADTYQKDLTQKEESWNELKEKYEGELTELHKRREEVLHQNNLLHTQLENITNQITALKRDRASIPEEEQGEAVAPDLENLQEVIKYLRQEKEIVDVQYHLSTQESKRLRQQFEYTQSQLDEARLKLEQQRRAAADSDHNALSHNKLMETLNELNLFRESSVTLRSQVKQAETALAEKSGRVDSLEQQIEPLKTKISELENVVETKDEEMRLLQADRDRWQQRTQNILQKYDRVDPAEMEGLKEQLTTLEKARDEAVAARDALQAEVDGFPEKMKTHGDERVHDLRAKLTEQFKARSKELSGRINAKQAEMNAVIQEKEVLQEELKTTKEELTAVKAKLAEKPASPAAAPVAEEPPTAPTAGVDSTPASQFPVATTQVAVPADEEKVKALEEKIQRLEAALAEKDAAIAAKDAEREARIKERADRLKETFNSKMAEVRAAHRQELENLKSAQPSAQAPAPQEPNTPGPQNQQAPATPVKSDGELPELTDAQARALVASNKTIQTIVRSNIRAMVAKEKEKDSQEAHESNQESMSAMEQRFNQEREALKKAHEEGLEEKIKSAVELSDKKTLVKISMLDTRCRTALAKIEVVQKAATDTPQKPVVEVWEVAKTTKAPPAAPPKPQPAASPAQQPPQPAAQPPTPVPVMTQPTPAVTAPPQPTPAVQSQQQAQPQVSVSAPVPQPEPAPESAAPESTQVEPETQADGEQEQEEGQVEETDSAPATAPPAANGPQQQQQPSSLPSKPPAGSGVIRGLQSALPVARGGRGGGRGGQHNPFGPQGQQQQQQQGQSQRGTGIGRGRGGRGGFGRGANQNVQTNIPQGQGQGQGQPSPGGGRGHLSANARQFVPQGNKRAREDGGDGGNDGAANAGKRMRGGGQPRGS